MPFVSDSNAAVDNSTLSLAQKKQSKAVGKFSLPSGSALARIRQIFLLRGHPLASMQTEPPWEGKG